MPRYASYQLGEMKEEIEAVLMIIASKKKIGDVWQKKSYVIKR